MPWRLTVADFVLATSLGAAALLWAFYDPDTWDYDDFEAAACLTGFLLAPLALAAAFAKWVGGL